MYLICPKHGIIEPDDVVFRSPSNDHPYCGHCARKNGKWVLLHRWTDELTREDFQEDHSQEWLYRHYVVMRESLQIMGRKGVRQ